MIVVRELMVQLVLMDNFRNKFLAWDDAEAPMNWSGNFLVKLNLTKRKMQEVVVQTVEQSSTREVTKLVLKILSSTFVKVELEKVTNNAVHLNTKQNESY